MDTQLREQSIKYRVSDTMQVDDNLNVVLWTDKEGNVSIIRFDEIRDITAYEKRITIHYKKSIKVPYYGSVSEIKRLVSDFKKSGLIVTNRT